MMCSAVTVKLERSSPHQCESAFMVSKAYTVAFERAWDTSDGSEDESISLSLVFGNSNCGFFVMVVDVAVLAER